MEAEDEISPGSGGGSTVIVIGNEKGGTGKSTTAIHLAVGLLYRGLTVGTLDLDPRQATLTRYLNNREQFARREKDLPMPRRLELSDGTAEPAETDEEDARNRIRAALRGLRGCDVVIVDTPGHPSTLSRVGHEEADILITPVNDSLIDIDVLAEIDPVNRTIVAPSFYCRMAWEYHNRRIVEGRTPIDWIVIRNRLPHVHSNNQRDVDAILRKLSRRIGFRLAPGLGERVVFRELFLNGLTVLDLPTVDPARAEGASQRSAREEIDALLRAIAVAPRSRDRSRRVANA
jgi:chromosome partitioning protein